MSSKGLTAIAILGLLGFTVTAAMLVKIHKVSHDHDADTGSVISTPSANTALSANGDTGTETATVETGITASLNEQIVLLQRSVEQQQQTILSLTRDMATLKEDLAAVEAVAAATTSDASTDTRALNTESTDLAAVVNDGFAPTNDRRGLAPRDALVRSGVDEIVAEQLTQRLDARALADLQIRDQAAREGWLTSPDFRERRDALLPEAVSVRDELGDDTWDRYLYNSGSGNRVVVSSIMAGSAAQLTGILPGDTIYSYAGSRIFTMRELRQATQAGEAGEPTEVQVLRDGSSIILDVPRGPLGVSMTAARVDP